jgi:hypothetical protein
VLLAVQNDMLHHIVTVLALGQVQGHLEQLLEDEGLAGFTLAVLEVFLDHSTAIWVEG